MANTKIIVVGYNDKNRQRRDDDDMCLLVSALWLIKHPGYNDHFVGTLRPGNGECESYDMETHPERGDALDHIDEDTRLVVALHICGLHYHESPQFPVEERPRKLKLKDSSEEIVG
jgi:hypothetical protein